MTEDIFIREKIFTNKIILKILFKNLYSYIYRIGLIPYDFIRE